MILPSAPANIKENANDKYLRLFLSHCRYQPIADTYYRYNAKEGKNEFAVFAGNFSTPSCAFVFYKVDLKPTENGYGFVEDKVCFDVYFAPLVDDKYQQNNKECVF